MLDDPNHRLFVNDSYNSVLINTKPFFKRSGGCAPLHPPYIIFHYFQIFLGLWVFYVRL